MTLGAVVTTSVAFDAIGAWKDTRLIGTPYGVVEQQLLSVGSETVVAIRRSTGPSWQPPHEVNYRANMFAFLAAGVTAVVATNLVGSLHTALSPGSIVLPDQFLDFTRGRLATVFDRYGHRHVDVSEPFCGRLRAVVRDAAGVAGIELTDRATYVAVEGPRYETRAEVTAYARLGGDVVGMTCATEAIMARELGLCYASVALVSNYGAGLTGESLRPDAMLESARDKGAAFRTLVHCAMHAALETRVGGCCASAQPFTQPSWRDAMLQVSGPAGNGVAGVHG